MANAVRVILELRTACLAEDYSNPAGEEIDGRGNRANRADDSFGPIGQDRKIALGLRDV